VAEIREACAGHQSDIASANHRKMHCRSPKRIQHDARIKRASSGISAAGTK